MWWSWFDNTTSTNMYIHMYVFCCLHYKHHEMNQSISTRTIGMKFTRQVFTLPKYEISLEIIFIHIKWASNIILWTSIKGVFIKLEKIYFANFQSWSCTFYRHIKWFLMIGNLSLVLCILFPGWYHAANHLIKSCEHML